MNALKRSLVIAILALLCSQAFAADAKEAAAARFATDWLTLLDAGKYEQCWKQTSPSFQSSIRRDKWEAPIGPLASPAGEDSRPQTLKCGLHQRVVGAEDGEYVVVTFVSSFERLGSGIETVIPQLQPDGNWKISGYSVKPSDANDLDLRFPPISALPRSLRRRPRIRRVDHFSRFRGDSILKLIHLASSISNNRVQQISLFCRLN